MGYIIGISSGMSDIGLGRGGGEASPSRITLSGKSFYGAFTGVRFVQIDVESLVEFLEPDLKRRLERIRKEQGLEFGIHGECAAMKAGTILLDSAFETVYISSHKRLLLSLKHAKEIKAKYFLIHASEYTGETPPISKAKHDLKSTAIVDFWGRRMHRFLEELEKNEPEVYQSLVNWLINQNEFYEIVMRGVGVTNLKEFQEYYKGRVKREVGEEQLLDRYAIKLFGALFKNLTEDEKRKVWERMERDLEEAARKEVIDRLHNFSKTDDLAYGSEVLAYMIIAKYMSIKRDPIWKEIVGDRDFDERLKLRYGEWVPAVASKYLWGHFNLDKAPSLPEWAEAMKKEKELNFTYNPKDFLSKDLELILETGMVPTGAEEEARLAKPSHLIALCKNMNSRYVKVAIDFEHCLGAGINIEEELGKIKNSDAKWVKVLHVGFPTPLQPAHVPIPLGSEEQELLYRWMFELRRKGWDESEDRYIIFERGGGAEPVQDSIIVLRKIIEYLRKDKPIDKFDLEEIMDFFGVDRDEIKREESAIRMHALDPIKDLMAVPEEKHTFLGRRAVEEGKAESWRKEEFR